jgi:hypothetical protein
MCFGMVTCSEPVPENVIKQFNTDSATDSLEKELVDSLFDNIEFDFDEEVDLKTLDSTIN